MKGVVSVVNAGALGSVLAVYDRYARRPKHIVVKPLSMIGDKETIAREPAVGPTTMYDMVTWEPYCKLEEFGTRSMAGFVVDARDWLVVI